MDTIFLQARAYTLNDAQPWAEAIAVHGGRIVYVGDDAGALALAGPRTVRHDLAGRMLLPGLIDAHMHLIAGGGYALALSLDSFGSIEDWVQAIGDYARENPDAPVLFGYGFLASSFGPSGPTRQMIDAVVADRPVLMMDEGFHGAWANTRALERLGITRDTPDPDPGFSTYERDAAGEPTGYLLEGTAETAMEALNAIEAARHAHPASASRYAICHIQVITDEDLPRFAELGVIAQSTPLWASYDVHGRQFVSQDQFERFWRFNSLAKLGTRLTFGSDFPASGAGMLGLSPIVQIEIGHTRQEAGDPSAPVQPRDSERLAIAALIRGYTLDAAYQLHMEDEIGSLEVGKRADLVVLERNLFETPTYEIHQTPVAMTLLDGEVVYRADADPESGM